MAIVNRRSSMLNRFHYSRGKNTLFCLSLAVVAFSAIVGFSDRLTGAEEATAAFLKYCYGCDNQGWNVCLGCNGTGLSKLDLGEECPVCDGKGRTPCGVPGCPYRR
jgi:hypothetical protein